MTDRPHDWHRLSPRMLLVHPVHEMLRQLPVLIGSVVLGSATGNPVWPLAALGVTVVFGVLRWFFTTYRIDDENVSLRTGILSRRAVSVPRNRIRSVQTEARLWSDPAGPRTGGRRRFGRTARVELAGLGDRQGTA